MNYFIIIIILILLKMMNNNYTEEGEYNLRRMKDVGMTVTKYTMQAITVTPSTPIKDAAPE